MIENELLDENNADSYVIADETEVADGWIVIGLLFVAELLRDTTLFETIMFTVYCYENSALDTTELTKETVVLAVPGYLIPVAIGISKSFCAFVAVPLASWALFAVYAC